MRAPAAVGCRQPCRGAAPGEHSVWWLGLVSGILMIVLAFWTGGQFFLKNAYTLLVFAGIWALMQGLTDIVRAFEVRRLWVGC